MAPGTNRIHCTFLLFVEMKESLAGWKVLFFPLRERQQWIVQQEPEPTTTRILTLHDV
jgi:hypothetical protein